MLPHTRFWSSEVTRALCLFAPAVAFVAGVGVERRPILSGALCQTLCRLIQRPCVEVTDEVIETGGGKSCFHDVILFSCAGGRCDVSHSGVQMAQDCDEMKKALQSWVES
jgi:hypothetical protein